jgi:subtilase family serine protease
LRIKADPKSVLQESNETNNGAWANLQLNAETGTVTVLRVGPGA